MSGVVVVVPASDEEHEIRDCLEAVAVARGACRVPTTCVVVLDRCRDRTAAVVADLAGVEVVHGDWACVGRARRAGVQRALAMASAAPPSLWLAHTDGDSRPPPDWLSTMVHLADAGADVVCGTVTPRIADPWLADRWASGYEGRDGHGHVHGANLGTRASSYLRVGGFPPVETGEDVGLVAAACAGRLPIAWTGRIPVSTSGRVHGRAPAGMAADIRELAAAGRETEVAG